MDSKTSIDQLRKRLKVSREIRGWRPDERSQAISLILEAAELLEHFQFKNSEEVMVEARRKSGKFEEIEMELADVFYWAFEMADKLGIDLTKTMDKKLKKIDEKYPADKLIRGGEKYYYLRKRKYRNMRKK